MAASKKENSIIEVKHLSKQYNIGVDRTYKTFCDSFTSAMRHPLKMLQDSHKQNDTFWALKDVNFEVERGDVVGIIGRNGAGKSTLLKILSRITYPTEGEITMRGRVGSLLEVGTGFHPELTGRENIYFNGAILGMKKREIDDKFEEIVKFSGTEKFLDTPVKRYSSGMQVRLAFSVAANLDPEILVVDEVLAVGDAAFQKKCLGKMSKVAKEGRTVLFVSHNMAAINSLCERGILLEHGSKKFIGTIEEAIENYLCDKASVDDQNLFDITNRSGNGLVKVCNLEFNIDSISKKTTSGHGMKVVIEYESKKDQLPIQFLLGVYNLFNTCIIFLDSLTAKGLPTFYPMKGKVVVEISNEFSLAPGRYYVNIAAIINGEMADYIQNALTLYLENGNFFGTGKSPAGKSLVFVKQEWSVE